MTVKEDVTYAGFALGWSAVRKMPERTAYRTFERIADRAWRARGKGVVQLERNLRRVAPDASSAELRELSRASMHSYFRYWCDAFRLPDWSPERIVETFQTEDREILDDAYRQGRGVIAALGHMGNWDHAGAWGSLDLGPVTAVAERLKPERLFRQFVRYRESIGIRIRPLGTPNLTDSLADDVRREHRIVALLADRDLGVHGVDVEFFGETTRMPAGPANLALRTGAPLVPANLFYNERGAGARACAPIAVPDWAPRGDDCGLQPGYEEAVAEITQRLALVLQEGVARHPTDWHMLQPLWLADLDPDRLAAVNARREADRVARLEAERLPRREVERDGVAPE